MITKIIGSIKDTFSDIRSLLDIPYILSSLGTFLWRNGLKRTSMIAVLGYFVNLFTKILFGKPFLPYSGIAGFSIIFIIASILGLLFKFIGNLLTSKNIVIAQANFLNLLEDKKKSKRKKHLKYLWDNVFKYETILLFSQEEIRKREREIEGYRNKFISFLKNMPYDVARNYLNFDPEKDEDIEGFLEGIDAFRPLSSDKGIMTEIEFMISSLFALTHSFRISEEERLIGYDLKLLEDWYDGAYFTLEDKKLYEQIKGNTVLRELYHMIKMPKSEKIRLFFVNLNGVLWFKAIMKTLEMRVGRIIITLNEQFPEYDINAEHIFWPSKALINNEEVFETIEKMRISLLSEIFGENFDIAKRRLNRFQRRNFENAYSIRKRLDPDFIYNVSENYFKIFRLGDYRIKREMLYIKKKRDELMEIEKFIREKDPHIRPYRLRSLLLYYLMVSKTKDEFKNNLGDILKNIYKIEGKLTKKLLTLKIHCELVKLEVEDYEEELKELVYDN